MKTMFLYDVKCRRCGSIITMSGGSSLTEREFYSYMDERSKGTTTGECDKCANEGHTTVCDYISWSKKIITR